MTVGIALTFINLLYYIIYVIRIYYILNVHGISIYGYHDNHIVIEYSIDYSDILYYY